MSQSDAARSIFLLGLRNAHAMENQALSIMKPQVSRIENYPGVAQKLEDHIRWTDAQIQRLEGILNELGETASSLKDAALSLGGSLAAIGHSAAGDEILKNSLANFAFENYEIAAYRSLASLTKNGGFSSALPAIEQNLAEEKVMAAWLEDNLDAITRNYAALSATGSSGKIGVAA
jgi:ferritin-like metal-binding protein YciE